MDETKHVIVFKTAYFEVVVSHGYFDLLTYATSHSVIRGTPGSLSLSTLRTCIRSRVGFKKITRYVDVPSMNLSSRDAREKTIG
jgi:hypothetical protein